MALKEHGWGSGALRSASWRTQGKLSAGNGGPGSARNSARVCRFGGALDFN